MFQGIWCRLSMFFSPAGRLAQSQLLGTCTILCMPMLGGTFCCSQSHCLRQGSHWTGNLLFLRHWLTSPPVSIPQHWDYRCIPVGHLNSGPGFLQQALCPISQFPSLSAYLLKYSYLHHTPRGFYSTLFLVPNNVFCTAKHSSQPADPWEFPRLLTYKGQNYFCNNTKTLFILVHWHLHWLSKWTDG